MKLLPASFLITLFLAGGVALHYRLPAPRQSTAEKEPAASPAVQATPVKPVSAAVRPRPPEDHLIAGHGPEHYQDLMAWLATATPEEMERMATAMVKQSEELSVRLIMARWAEMDAAGLMTWAAARIPGDGYGEHYWEGKAWEAWGRVDFNTAWSVVKDERARSAVLLGLTASDPARALELLHREPRLKDIAGWTYMGDILGRIARRLPLEAAQFAGQNLESGEGYPVTVGAVWSLTDPAAALAWARGRGREQVANVLESLVANAGREGQVEVIAEMVAALPDGQSRARLDAMLLAQLARRDPAAALAALEARPTGAGKQFAAMGLVEEFTRSGHLSEALQIAEKLHWKREEQWLPDYYVKTVDHSSESSVSETGHYKDALMQLARGLAQTDPDAAARIITGGAMSDVVEVLAKTLQDRPAVLAGAVLSRPAADPERSDLLSTTLESWMERDAAAAAEWMAKAPVEEVVEDVCKVWAVKDPEAVLQWARAGHYPEEALEAILERKPEFFTQHLEEAVAMAPEAAEEWFSQLAEKDPASTVKFLPLLPDTAELPGDSMHYWMEHEPEQAAQWVESLPAGTRRDTATGSLSEWYRGREEYDAAWRWAALMPTEAGDVQLSAILEGWSKGDARAAEAAMAALPPERRKEVRRFSSTADPCQ